MKPSRITKLLLWGGMAAILAGTVLFGAGSAMTITAPSFPLGELRGEGITQAGTRSGAIGMGIFLLSFILDKAQTKTEERTSQARVQKK